MSKLTLEQVKEAIQTAFSGVELWEAYGIDNHDPKDVLKKF